MTIKHGVSCNRRVKGKKLIFWKGEKGQVEKEGRKGRGKPRKIKKKLS